MKSKILCAILTTTIGINMFSLTAFAESPGIFDMPTINMTETLKDSRSCHDNYTQLVKAMMVLVKNKVISKSELSNIHTYYENLKSSDPNTVPTTDMGLLDALLKANLVTKSQYDQLVPMLK